MYTNKTIGRIVGVLFIIGTGAGVPSKILGTPFLETPELLKMVAANTGQIGLIGFLVLLMGVALAGVAAMMFPILKKQNEALATGYVIFRGALETFTYLGVALCWLVLPVLAREYTASGAAAASQLPGLGNLLLLARDPITAVQDIVFPVGALMFYYLLFQARLIPRWMSGWGFLGAIAYLITGLVAVFTGTHLVPLLLPLGLQEMVMAVWLIAKGFSPSAVASEVRSLPLAA
jgi:hypothetical protein